MKRLTTEQFIKKARAVHGDKYDYSLVDYKNAKIKVKIICHEHGVFEQRPGSHLSGNGCPKCSVINSKEKQRYTVDQFIEKAKTVHGDRYNYKFVDYKNNHIKVMIVCPVHGIFEQIPNGHLQGQGCSKCKGGIKLTTEQFIKKARAVHGDKYDYSLVEYKNAKTKIKIICPIHGIFEQTPDSHLHGAGCSKCRQSTFIPAKYNIYQPQLEPYGIKCRRDKEDQNILEVKCMYCDRWYKPSRQLVQHKIGTINGKESGEQNLYCSDECKKACPTYKQVKYPKDYKINTSREVQPELRKLVLKRDNYTCQKCNTTNTELHCHHYEGIEANPVESADIDQCITLCKRCHNDVHKKDKCGMKDYQRGKC